MDRALTTDEMIERARYCADYGIFTAAENGKSVGFAEMAERLQSLQAKLDEKDVVMGGKDERIAKLEEALEPFADALGDDDEDEADHLQGTLVIGRSTIYCLDLGDFRRARAALNPRTQDD